MPLLGKIVVIKRNGGDGTEFPLTASCMFGRKLDCDIRIQLPQVSKEHCKIELNENKELILTNLSSVNPTRINGEVLHQSERLKHGDLITIIDRSFRFEYPPPKTPKKKRLSTTGKDKTPQVSQDQLERQDKTPVPVEKRKSEHLFDTCLKDGSNLPPSVEQAIENAPEDGKLKKDSMSPFCELYEMVKQDLAAKSPWKPGLPNTPLARPQVDHEKRARDEQAAVGTEDTSNLKQVTTSSTKKRRSSKVNSEDKTEPDVAEDMPSVGSSTPTLTEGRTTPVSQKKGTPLKTPQKFSAGEVVQQLLLEPQNENKTPKSPKGRRSGGSRDQSLLSTPKGQTTPHIPLDQTQEPEGQNTDVKPSPRTSPRTNAGKRFQVHDVLCHIKTSTTASEDKDNISVNEECDSNGSHTDLTVPRARRKRVSFGGQLSPELFDKRLPPNSPLRRGATPGRRSLGTFQKSQSLLRRASTIGLMAFRLEKTVPESTKAQNGSAKKASPKRASSEVKTPSPTKRSPITKAKTPSPKQQKSPSGAAKVPSPSSTSATPKTPASARRASNSFNRSSAEGSMTETPRLQGRFSVSRVSTPSPDQRGKAEAEPTLDDVPQDCVTPKIPLRRKSMKSSARKTPRSAVKSALDVMRSRRSGASRANLKVLNSWADIVKFGQIKPQTEVATKKKITKGNLVKKTVPKPKTPARRLKDDVSTGHAASPVSIVVGKAHMRTQQPVGAAPKIVPNIALFKKDMKMDEDLTGVAEIFKTPAHRKCKNAVLINNESAETVLDEVSVMKTPEESGEMIVSPLSVVSAAKSGRYNNEAVTRLLLDNHDCSLVEQKALSQIESIDTHGHEIIPAPEMPPNDQTEEEEAVPETAVKTPKRIAAPSPCLTGVKKLMKTPKQKTEPVEDLRGKLLKTPKQPKLPQEENLEGVKELLKTPKQQGAPAEDMTGVKRVMPTNPVLCAAGLQRLMKTPKEKSEESEDLTGVRELMKTPKIKGEPVEKNTGLKRLLKTPKQNKKEVEEDLTGIQHLMKTPKHRGEAVENVMGVKRLMQTPKEKIEPVEDLTGVKQLMQTPKQKGEPVNKNFGISKLMKTPRQKRAVTEEDFTGLQELVQEPESSSNLTKQENSTQPTEEPVSAVETYTAVMLAEDSDEKCDDKETICPVNYMETLADTANAVDSDHSDQATEAEMPQQNLSNQNEKETISAEVISVCSSGEDGKIEELSAETACTSENTSLTVKATPSSSTAEQEEEVINSSPVNKSQRGGRGRAAQKSKTSKQEMAKAPAVAVRSLIEEEKVSGPSCSSPGRGRRVKKLVEVTESPIRKSSRAKGAKRYFEDEEAKNTAASQAPVNSINTETSDSLPVVTKVKRGRKAKQDDAVIEPIQDVNAVDASLPVAPEELVQAPIEKPGRTKKTANEMESQPQVHEPKPIICEENAVAPEAVELQSSVDPEVPVTATRIRKGRTTKKCLKTELTPSTAIMSTHAVVLDEKPMTPVKKPGRGRMAKKVLKDDPKVGTQIVAEANIDRKEEPEAPVAKSGRGRKAKQQKPQIAEEIDDKPAVDTNALVVVTEEHPETVPKPVRGGRRAKQTKAAVSVEAEQNVISVVEQAQVPVVKSVRKRAVVTEETEAQTELPVKRGRRAAVGPSPPVTAMPSSGCKSVIKVKPEVTEDATLTEVKPKKHTRQTTKVCESKTEEDPVTQVRHTAENTEVQKVGRGSRSRKEKSSTKDTSNIQINKSATAEEGSAAKSSKTVNCNSDLVASKDIEEFETSADMKESQLKKSKRMNKLPVETATTEIIQPTDQPSKGRRGRGAKKEEEPAVEDPQEETRIKVKPLRRGRAVASIAPKSEASEKKAASSLRKKRNEELEVRDDCVEKEPLPKKRGRVTSSTEAAAEVPVSSKEKRGKAIKTTPEAEPESAPKKNESRPARGQRKTAEEPHPAPAQTQGSVSGSSAGKAGRGVRKAEADVSTEAAPVRRTRRK